MKFNSRRLFLCLGCVLLLLAPLALRAEPTPARDRVVILVSLDAFRWDYLEKYQPTNLNRFAAQGVRARKLIPMFPSMTFPNQNGRPMYVLEDRTPISELV